MFDHRPTAARRVRWSTRTVVCGSSCVVRERRQQHKDGDIATVMTTEEECGWTNTIIHNEILVPGHADVGKLVRQTRNRRAPETAVSECLGLSEWHGHTEVIGISVACVYAIMGVKMFNVTTTNFNKKFSEIVLLSVECYSCAKNAFKVQTFLLSVWSIR